jgi:hypothetical protein
VVGGLIVGSSGYSGGRSGSGAARTVFEEKGPNYVEPYIAVRAAKVRTLGKDPEVIWLSERDGWSHLYLYDEKTGSLKNQITSGAWVVRTSAMGLLCEESAGSRSSPGIQGNDG